MLELERKGLRDRAIIAPLIVATFGKNRKLMFSFVNVRLGQSSEKRL